MAVCVLGYTPPCWRVLTHWPNNCAARLKKYKSRTGHLSLGLQTCFVYLEYVPPLNGLLTRALATTGSAFGCAVPNQGPLCQPCLWPRLHLTALELQLQFGSPELVLEVLDLRNRPSLKRSTHSRSPVGNHACCATPRDSVSCMVRINLNSDLRRFGWSCKQSHTFGADPLLAPLALPFPLPFRLPFPWPDPFVLLSILWGLDRLSKCLAGKWWIAPYRFFHDQIDFGLHKGVRGQSPPSTSVGTRRSGEVAFVSSDGCPNLLQFLSLVKDGAEDVLLATKGPAAVNPPPCLISVQATDNQIFCFAVGHRDDHNLRS